VERTWRAEDAVSADPLPFADAKDALLAAFLEGCARATADADDVAITLSGGMDSRCLLAAALTLGKPVRSVHMSDPGGRADVYARRMAAACGVPHQAYAPSPALAREYYTRLARLVARHEGMVLEPETEVSWLRDQMAPDAVMLHGGYAELSKLGDLRRFHLTAGLLRTDGPALVDALWARFAGPLERRLRVFVPAVAAELRERARASFAARVEEIAGRRPGLDAASIVQVVFLEEQVKVEKYSGHMWNARVRTRFPFSYPRYVDQVLRVPPGDRRQQTFQMHLLRRLQPVLYRVPDANTGVRVDAPAALRFAVRVLSKIRRDLLGSRRVQEHADVRGWIGMVVPPLGEALARDLDLTLYDRPALERVVADIARSHHAGETLQALVLFEAWRAYLGLRAPLGDVAAG
jgi:asparagine synthase (glutamine-hydrolysing)